MKVEALVLRKREGLEQARSYASAVKPFLTEILAQELQFAPGRISQRALYSHLQDFSLPGPLFEECLQ
jgi:hypothetical protein